MLEYTFAVHYWDPHHPLAQSHHSGAQVSCPQQHSKLVSKWKYAKRHI